LYLLSILVVISKPGNLE